MAKTKVKKPNVVASKKNKKKPKAGQGIMIEDISLLMKQDFLSYTIANMVRSIPDYRDGLKPSHRRALFTLFQLGSGLKKSARIVGEMLGKYHPHGDQAAYSTIVRMAQDFKNNICLVKPQGNFGSIDGDSAASMRYCCTGDTVVKTSIGTLDIVTIYDALCDDKRSSTIELNPGDLKVKSYDGKYNNVSAVFNSGEHPIIEIVLRNGMRLKGSNNHPVMTLSKNLTFEWVKLEDVTEDTEVLIDCTHEETLYEFTENYDVSEAKFLGTMVSEGYITREGEFGINNKDEHLVNVVMDYISMNKYNFMDVQPSELSEYEMLLVTIADHLRKHTPSIMYDRNISNFGYIGRVLNTFFINNEHIHKTLFEYNSSISSIINDMFNLIDNKLLNPKIVNPYSIKDDKCMYTYQAKNTPICKWLTDVCLFGRYSHNRRVPPKVFVSDKEYRRNFLRYLFEGDGCVTVKDGEVDIRYTTNSLVLANDLMILLSSMSIPFTYAEDNRNKDTSGHKVHIICLSGRESVCKFYNEIGFASVRKQANLEKGVSMLEPSTFRNNISIYNSKNIKSYIERRFRSDRQMRCYSEGLFNDNSLYIMNEDRALFNFIKEFYSKYRVTTIKEINHLEPETVYSFRVDSDCHSYISNGIISHNTECEMADFTKDVYFNDEFVAVEMIDNFDGTLKEPSVLCPKLPVALINGVSGIATGVATDVPPHNISEVANLVMLWLQYKVQNKLPKSYEIFLDCIKGPDFPTGGVIYDTSGMGIRNGITVGAGQVWILPKFHIEKYDYGRDAIIIDEMAFKLVKADMIEKIANLVKDGKLEGISDLKDESDGRNGIRVIIVLKKGVDYKRVIDYLVSAKVIATQIKYSMTFVRNNKPVKMGVIDIVDYHTQHRKEVLLKFFAIVIQKAESDLHLQEGLLVFIKNFKEISTIIINGKDENDVISKLMKKYKLSKSQVNFILDTKMRKNIKHGEQVKSKIAYLKQRIKDFNADLKNPYRYMLREVEELASKYKAKRKTKIVSAKSIKLDEPKKKTKK